MTERWVGCPLCGRSARTSRELNAAGCEGKHLELMPIEEALAALKEIANRSEREYNPELLKQIARNHVERIERGSE